MPTMSLNSPHKLALFVMLALAAVAPSTALAQAPQAPVPAPAPAPPPTDVLPPDENYRVEISAGAWFTVPSTALYSDTEVVTSGSTSTTINGTNFDFKTLGLSNKLFPVGQL